MNFEPICNYYGLDLSKNKNSLIFAYWEFIKTLVLLSSPAKKQKEIVGFGNTIEEIIIDFESYYTVEPNRFLEAGFLTEEIISKLNIIDTFFDKKSNDLSFWDDDLLAEHTDWEKVRLKTSEILIDLNFNNLIIKIERTNENGFESTKTFLIYKT